MMMMMVPIFGTFPPSFADDAHTCALSFVIPPSSLFNKIKSIAFTALSRGWVGMQEAGGNERQAAAGARSELAKLNNAKIYVDRMRRN